MYISNWDQLFPAERVYLKVFLKDSKYYEILVAKTKKPKQNKKGKGQSDSCRLLKFINACSCLLYTSRCV